MGDVKSSRLDSRIKPLDSKIKPLDSLIKRLNFLHDLSLLVFIQPVNCHNPIEIYREYGNQKTNDLLVLIILPITEKEASRICS